MGENSLNLTFEQIYKDISKAYSQKSEPILDDDEFTVAMFWQRYQQDRPGVTKAAALKRLNIMVEHGILTVRKVAGRMNIYKPAKCKQ